MGRPKTFTVESVLDKMIVLFRRRGYLNTSMQAIADHIGLSRASIYATFGDKHGLFVQTLHRYGPTCRAPGLDELRDAASPRAALLRVFELAIACPGAGLDQCLFVNAAIELRHRTPEITAALRTAFENLEACFREAIERGMTENEIAGDVDPVQTARSLLGLYLGLWVLIRSGGAGEPVLRAVVLQVQSLLPEKCAVA